LAPPLLYLVTRRSAEVAAYWALVPREDDEGRASILIFDRQSLARRYKIEANPEVFWIQKYISTMKPRKKYGTTSMTSAITL
jgi:hypothetical protein